MAYAYIKNAVKRILLSMAFQRHGVLPQRRSPVSHNRFRQDVLPPQSYVARVTPRFAMRPGTSAAVALRLLKVFTLPVQSRGRLASLLLLLPPPSPPLLLPLPPRAFLLLLLLLPLLPLLWFVCSHVHPPGPI